MATVNKQNGQPGKEELREFGLVTGAILAVLFGLLLPWLFGHVWPLWPWIAAGVLWGWALLLPASLLPVYRGWMAIGHVLGWLNTRIILGIIFYLMFLPVGLLMRLLSKDPMARSIDKSIATYRVTHARPKKDHVERPY
jgi:hypothetical protein